MVPVLSAGSFVLQVAVLAWSFVQYKQGTWDHDAQTWTCEALSMSMFVIFVDSAGRFALFGSVQQFHGGKFLKHNDKLRVVPANVGWMVMESPSLLIPAYFALYWADKSVFWGVDKIALACFVLHYFHRAFIYSNRLKGSPMRIDMISAGVLFTTSNGLAQSLMLTHLNHVHNVLLFSGGFLLFIVGMLVNIQSDYILIGLRGKKEKGKHVYRIPRGGMFKYVSGANFLGEIMEWWGYAMMTGFSYAGTAFALQTLGIIGTRALATHENYKRIFGDGYPKDRRALIPYLY
mmetsp:Transcript_5020/g.7634  ORF Transcript_5020/g.7634 Transcript_5020/m.7634 type:complete len:290 (-) Transcript_5020:588-1457(-)